MEQFLGNLCEILELENSLSSDKLLSEIEEWDSLAVVTFIAMADLKYKKTIQISEIRNAIAIADLYELVQN